MLIIDNSNIRTLKTITRDINLSPSSRMCTFLLTEFGLRHRRCYPLALSLLSYLDNGFSPAIHSPPFPINLQSLRTSSSLRKKWVCRWDEWWEHLPSSLLEASINFRDPHIFNPVLNRFLSQN